MRKKKDPALALLKKEDIEQLKIDEKILVYTLSLKHYVKKSFLIKNYYGPDIYNNLSKLITLNQTYDFFKSLNVNPESLDEIPDTYPFFRRTYYKNFINSMLMQIELFVHKRTHLAPPDIMSSLIGGHKVAPLFNPEQEFEKTKSILQKYGFKTLDDYRIYRNQYKMEKLPSSTLKFLLCGFYEEIVDRLIQETAEYNFPFSDLFEKSFLSINPMKDQKENFYNYNNYGRGSIGIYTHPNIDQSYIKTCMLKETVPGKHLYTLIRQYLCDHASKDIPQDALRFVEPMFSPERIFHDSIPFCSKLLFPKLVDTESYLAFEIEKLYCKLIYNAWYYRFIDRSKSSAKYLEFVSKILNIEERHLKFKTRRLFEDSRYTMAFVPYGIYLIEESITHCTTNSVIWFFTQESVDTLDRCLLQQEEDYIRFDYR